MLSRILRLAFACCWFAAAVSAQGTQLAFGGLQTDPSLPVEVSADVLDVNQTDGTAIFSGNVVVGQGEMRLSASKVQVVYNAEQSGIERLIATGDVVLVNGPDAAEADAADYTIDDGVIVMTGNVLLTQGPNALSSEKLTVDLTTGTARASGRVKTILVSEDNQ